ncbi:MAG: GNAT family N-acetyltransferase [Desulfovibrionaceae bacterium]
MATFIHRCLRRADIPAICGLPATEEEAYFAFPSATFPLTPDHVLETLRVRLEPTVFLRGNVLAGYANLTQYVAGMHCAVGNVIVAPAQRGQGLGAHIVRHMAQLAFTAHGMPEVRIGCFGANTRALLLYHRLGFVPFTIEQRLKNNGTRTALIHLRMTREAFQSGALGVAAARPV